MGAQTQWGDQLAHHLARRVIATRACCPTSSTMVGCEGACFWLVARRAAETTLDSVRRGLGEADILYKIR
jgi:hypothetical protein